MKLTETPKPFICKIYTKAITASVPSGKGELLLTAKSVANLRRTITRRFGCVRGFEIKEIAA